MKKYILIPQLSVQAANAISSPLTYGFPAVTSFLGFGHALQRHFNGGNAAGELQVTGVGIVCHQCQVLAETVGYDKYLQLTANPLDSKGGRPSFVEEGRCHLTVSLVLECDSIDLFDGTRQRLAEIIFSRMKLAGGDILQQPEVIEVQDDRAALRKLMPGYALMQRRDLMTSSMATGMNALQAMHHHLKLTTKSHQDADGQVRWSSSRAGSGWIVPIAIGFQGLTPLGHATNGRDQQTPHRFAESVLTLGQFVMPYRLDSLEQILWRYQHSGDLYLCQQDQDYQEPDLPILASVKNESVEEPENSNV